MLSETIARSKKTVPAPPIFPAPRVPFRDRYAGSRMAFAIALSLIANIFLLTEAATLARSGNFAAMPGAPTYPTGTHTICRCIPSTP